MTTILDGTRTDSTAPQRTVNIDDIVVHTAKWSLLGVATIVASALLLPGGVAGVAILIVAGIVAIGSGIWANASTLPNKTAMATSTVAYGILVGAISGSIAHLYGSHLVIQAVTAVMLVAVAATLLHKTGTVNLNSAGINAFIGYACLALLGAILVGFILIPFGVNLFGPGSLLGWGLAIAGVVISCISLGNSLAKAADATRNGTPAAEATRLGWNITFDAMWCYVEVLRILSFIEEITT